MVVLVGEKKAIGMAVKGRIEGRRYSKLGEWLVYPARAADIKRDSLVEERE